MSRALMTADELLKLNHRNKWTELVRGQLMVREPSGWLHGLVAQRVATALAVFVERERLGLVFGAETGFTLFRHPDTVRAPDAAFVSKARIPSETPRGFAEIAPDLVAEVLSPDDRPGDVQEKIADWIDAGVRIVWIIDPRKRSARVVHANGPDIELDSTSALTGEDMLPGFALELARLFENYY